jgi:hypothetical protein
MAVEPEQVLIVDWPARTVEDPAELALHPEQSHRRHQHREAGDHHQAGDEHRPRKRRDAQHRHPRRATRDDRRQHAAC